jgi:hypothetical protein
MMAMVILQWAAVEWVTWVTNKMIDIKIQEAVSKGQPLLLFSFLEVGLFTIWCR